MPVTPVFQFRAGEPYAWQNLHNSIGELCNRNGLEFVDLAPSLQTRDSAGVSFDIWHPNELGHVLIADALAERLAGTASVRAPR